MMASSCVARGRRVALLEEGGSGGNGLLGSGSGGAAPVEKADLVWW